MSSTTFYANFSGKEDLMAAAIDSACAQAVAAALPAFSRAGEWPDAVKAGLGALLNFLYSRPDLAYLVAVEVYAAGEAALRRCDDGLAPLGRLLANNTTEWSTMPTVTYELIAGTIRSLIFDALKRHGVTTLPALAPLCCYLALSPFLGADTAVEVASSGSGLRPTTSPGAGRRASGSGAFAFDEPIRLDLWRILNLVLLKREATVAEIAADFDKAPEVVTTFLRELVAIGALETVEHEDEVRFRSGDVPHRIYIVSGHQQATMDREERRRISHEVWKVIVADVEASMASGAFDSPEHCLTRTPLALDREGWRELTDLHDRFLMATFELHDRSQRRLRESGEAPIQARSLQLAFEMSPRVAPAITPTSPAKLIISAA
jgi:AcrR family transcriptional regulator